MYISHNVVNDILCRGYHIGIRLIDDFLSKSNVTRCTEFKETAEVIAKVHVYIYVWFYFEIWVLDQQS